MRVGKKTTLKIQKFHIHLHSGGRLKVLTNFSWMLQKFLLFLKLILTVNFELF